RPPAARVQLVADPERREPVVPEAPHPLRRLAEQHVDQVAGAEALAGPDDRREELLGGEGAVEGRDRLEAGVAVAARAGELLPEVREQRPAAAAGRLAVGQERLQALALGAPGALVAAARRQQARDLHDVLQAV